MMKTALLTITIFASLTVSSQHDIGLGLDVGTSRLYSTQSSGGGIEYNLFPSGNIGAYYRFKPESSKSNFLVELLISQIEGKLYSENDVIDQSFNIIGKETSDTYYHITSISLPVYYGLQFNKLGLLFGAEMAIPIYSGYNLTRNISYYDVNETTKQSDSPLNIDRVNFYGRIGFEWLITEKVLLRASYSHGLNIITRENGLPWKTHQASLGIRYRLMNK